MNIWRFKAADHGDVLSEDFWTTPEGAQESKDKFIAQHPQEASYCAMSIVEIHVDCSDTREE